MDIKKLTNEIESEITKIKTEEELTKFYRLFLSKSGKITVALSELKNIEPNKRSIVGEQLNGLKRSTEIMFYRMQKKIKDTEINDKLRNDKLIDITIPHLNKKEGSLHPITLVTRKIVEICSSMGFHIVDGNEIVTEFENFDSVNVPKTHPARDMQDTFWLSNGQLLKTQTSALQNAVLKKYGPEFAAIFPGRCYRNEATDASHEFAFFQCEGMMVGKDISIANLIYVMKEILSVLFEKQVEVRLRPGYFPFVEPGFELDASCPFCDGKGCSTCKHGGWIEIVPCGMIHENVLKMGGVDKDKYHGFAFGIGLSRLAMMAYNIRDVRMFNSGNIEFLRGIKR